MVISGTFIVKTNVYTRHSYTYCVKTVQIRVISGPNTEKYGPEITPCLDIFHAVVHFKRLMKFFLRIQHSY